MKLLRRYFFFTFLSKIWLAGILTLGLEAMTKHYLPQEYLFAVTSWYQTVSLIYLASVVLYELYLLTSQGSILSLVHTTNFVALILLSPFNTLADPYKQALLMTNGHPILNFILLIVIYLAIRFYLIQINFTLVPDLFNHPEQFQRLMTVEEKQTLQSASHTVKQISFRFTNPMMSFLFTPPTVSKILDQPSQ